MKAKVIFKISASLLMLGLGACTKELPIKEVFKEEVQSKTLIDTQTEYLYSSSMLNASRSSQDALPFSSGDTKRVKLVWGKESLQVIETERDARFRQNATNDKLVLEIPVEHVDFQCSKDRYGECTNSEEEVRDISWNQKSRFKIKADAAKSGTLDLLPILIDRTLGGNCYQEVSSQVLDVKLEPDALNMSVERTFKTNIQCLGPIESLSDATISAVFHYSLVKVSAVASNDFKPVKYETEDQNTFGFFATEKSTLDVDNNATEAGRKTLMNHWNPNRSEITYFLSPEFAKPENQVIRDLTYKTVQALNDGLSVAGARFKIQLKDSRGQSPGDIRNSMIVLVEDPVASSVIGYGPQTEDPATGEIISARTVMFLGTIKKYIGYTYDEIIRGKRRERKESEKQAQEKAGDSKSAIQTAADLQQKIVSLKDLSLQKTAGAPKTSRQDSIGSVKPILSRALVQAMSADVRNYNKSRNMTYTGDVKAQFKYLQEAKNCAFGLNAEMISSGISPRLASRFAHDAKLWEQLSSKEKQDVIDIILPEIWIPTLIHEMGHNLGLRHNFQGSEDAQNFFTQAELQALGIDHEIPFSTVMEYGDDLKALPVLGKYDIAALRFGYSRQVELNDGSLIPIPESVADLKKSNPALELKAYGYCTDENTGINAGCRRFDLGSTYTDIVKNEIKGYLDRYETRNFRRGRANMSLVDDPAYAQGVYGRFLGLRLMQETYERIKYRYNLTDDNDVWKSVDFLADIKEASKLAGEFLIQVLETPDLTCVLAKAETPEEIYDVVPLSQLDSTQISCFDTQVSEKFVIIGQYGKLFQSKKDPNSTNAYADQIDVRGFWIDKLMASRVLMARQLGVSNLDKNMDNFLDRSDLKESLKKTVQDFLLNRMTSRQEVTFRNGETQVLELPVDTARSQTIEKPLFAELAQALRIPNQSVPFAQVLAGDAARYMIDAGREADGRDFAESLKVQKVRAIDNVKLVKGFTSIEIGADRWIASPLNLVASKALETRNVIQNLDKIERARLVQIWKAKEDKKPLADCKKEERFAWDLDNETLKAYLLGSLGTADFYSDLVQILPN